MATLGAAHEHHNENSANKACLGAWLTKASCGGCVPWAAQKEYDFGIMIQGAFESQLEKIGVSIAQRSQGSTSHIHVRGLLDNKWRTNSSFPWPIDGDFLSGSYARGTKIRPLDDIDVMMVIDGTGYPRYAAAKY